MKTIVYINPLKPGKLKEYQAFIAENMGPRKKEYSDLFHRYGLKNVKVYIHQLWGKEFCVVIHDAEVDALERLANFTSSSNPYDRWFCEKLAYFYEMEGDPYAKFVGEFESFEYKQLKLERDRQIRNFFNDIEKKNYEKVIHYFTSDGKIISPAYGTMEAKPFYKKLADDVKEAIFTIKNIFTDESNPDLFAVHITSSWKFKTEKSLPVEGVNIFEFSPNSSLIQSIKFIYDAHAFRQEVGSSS